ncbi:Glyoxylate/hydroxypyruvate reductase HPR3 [Vitis vinifera]|uniref:glyoxylate reductase (NADP(+)) n=1 Tax=Vitis vinifera TaxID=29760 RepID=A0A438BZM8_VITVI|nr:Glyoxylate/hydroxypyruvate reductase HPR3 [Vitis vinifera]
MTAMDELPLVLVHVLPPFEIPFKGRLQSRFQLIDSSDSTFSPHASVLLCVGPAPVSSDTLRHLPSLQCIVGSSAGVDHIDLEECRRRGITVTNAGSSFCEDGADFAIGLLIDVLRRISAADRYVRAGLWPMKGDYPLGSKVMMPSTQCVLLRARPIGSFVSHGGKRVGIVGLGKIGSEIAKRLVAFGCRIAYNSRNKKSSVSFPYYANICNLAANSDILIICCALTKETHHLIDKDVMTALGKEGVIINVGRGGLINEKELVQCLVQGQIRGAGLDVFENEPDVPKELFELENVVLSPHKAIATLESLASLQELIVGNLEAFFSNKPLLSPINLD